MSAGSKYRRRRELNLAQRLLSGAAWAFMGRAVGAASALLTSAILARMLDPEEMGAYFLLITIVMFGAIIARFGLKQTIVRLVAESLAMEEPGRAGKTLKIVVTIVTVGVFATGAIYHFVAVDWLAETLFDIPTLLTVSGVSVVWIAALAYQTPVAETFRGEGNIKLAVLFDGVLASALLAIILSAVWVTDRTVNFQQGVTLSALAAILALLCGAALLQNTLQRLRGTGEISYREVLTISTPLFVTNLAYYFITNFSLWVVASFEDANEVALYGAAWKLVMLVVLPLTLVNMSVQPVIADLYTRGYDSKLQNALRGTATLAGMPALVVLLSYVLLGREVLAFVYGTDYQAAATILVILSIGQFANVWFGSCSQVLALTGHQKHLMYITLTAGLITAGLVVFGAHLWGALGAAIGVGAGRLLQNLMAWLFVYKLTGLWSHATIRPRFVKLALTRVLDRT